MKKETDENILRTDLIVENQRLKKRLEAYERILEEENQYRDKALASIRLIQEGTIYRFGLVFKRFMIECMKKHGVVSFFRWFFLRRTKKGTLITPLSAYDELENTKHYINRGIALAMGLDVPYKKGIYLKEMAKIFIFASVPYYDIGGGQRSSQLAKTFHSLGYQVYYIYGFECSEKDIPMMYIPAAEHRSIHDISLEWMEQRLDASSMFIFEIPYDKFWPYLELAGAKGCTAIYEHIDNWETTLGNLFYDPQVFQRFLDTADTIVVTAKKLGEKVEERCSREYLYLPNAVDTDLFNPSKTYECPKDLRRGKRTLLYFGSLWGDWFDWDKIWKVADGCPRCEINLIGDYSGLMPQTRKKKKNVHFLGLKKQSQLPAYLQYSDFALLPFKKCEIGSYVSPLKIFEYIAMNKMVLATGLDDIQGYPNVICSDDSEEWVDIIREGSGTLVDSSVFLADNNWYCRCGVLLENAGLVPSETEESISVIVLNYNNRKVIQRCIDTLLAHGRRYGYEIIVVDNGSSDGSLELLEAGYKEKIRIIKNKKNGCSSGRNLGVAASKREYICFLDSDQWVTSDYWLDSALEIFQRTDRIGAVSWGAGWFTPGKVTGLIVDFLPNRAIDHPSIWYRTDIAYLGTDGLVMRRDLFLEVGGFDEYYDPTCFEDTDLSLKIRNSGYELAYCPYLSIMHQPHQTTQSGSRAHARLMQRNGEYFRRKWEDINPKLLEYYG